MMPSSDSGKPSDVPVPFASTIGSKPVGNNPRATTSGTVNQATMPLMKAPNGNVVDTLSLCRAEITCMNEESSIVKKGYSAEGREKHVVLGDDFQMAKDNLQQIQQPNMTIGDDGKQLALCEAMALCEATRVLQASAFCEKDSYFKSPNLVTQPCEIDYGPLNMDLHSHTPPLLTPLSSQSPYHKKIKSPGTLKVYSQGTWCKKKKGLSNTCANLMEAGTEAWIQQQREITPVINLRPTTGHEAPHSDTHTDYEVNQQAENKEDITEHFQQAKQQWEMAQELGVSTNIGHDSIIARICDMESRDSKEAEKLGNRSVTS